MIHNFKEMPRPKKGKHPCPWPVCHRCGLVWLKNARTEKAVKAACPGKDDPQ